LKLTIRTGIIFFHLIGRKNAVLVFFGMLFSLISESYLVWLFGSFDLSHGFPAHFDSNGLLLEALIAFLVASIARLGWLWICTNIGFLAGAKLGATAYEKLLSFDSDPEVTEFSLQLMGRQSEDASLVFVGLCWIWHSTLLITVVLFTFLFSASGEALIGAGLLAFGFTLLFFSIRNFLAGFSRESKKLISRTDKMFLVTEKARFSHQINAPHLSFKKYNYDNLLRLRFLQGLTVSLSQSSKSVLEILGCVGIGVFFVLHDRELISNAFIYQLPVVIIASLRILPALQRIFSSVSLLSGKKYLIDHIVRIREDSQ
jgi:hypothetical protein